jgi:mRNA-degrading endonuclease RelE of RelBE toxin-antitoxin system
MSYELILGPAFVKAAKRLGKKHPSLKADLATLFSDLKENPHQGTLLRPNVYKIRLVIVSKGRGKSGGGRVITYALDENQTVYLLTLYDKSEQSTISDSEIAMLYQEALDENIF